MVATLQLDTRNKGEKMSAKKATKRKPDASNSDVATTPTKARKDAESKPKKTSALDAAARVLGESKEPMNCQELIKTMADRGYWTSPGGKTPAATLYSAMTREIYKKGKDARFKRTERGKFATNS
jgi:hypothetical protein